MYRVTNEDWVRAFEWAASHGDTFHHCLDQVKQELEEAREVGTEATLGEAFAIFTKLCLTQKPNVAVHNTGYVLRLHLNPLLTRDMVEYETQTGMKLGPETHGMVQHVLGLEQSYDEAAKLNGVTTKAGREAAEAAIDWIRKRRSYQLYTSR
jgi:hypothetical protein